MSSMRVKRIVQAIQEMQVAQNRLNLALEEHMTPHLNGLSPESVKREIESLPECTARFNLWRRYLKT